MKTAYINGIILDGTKDMEPVSGKVIIVEDKKITNIINKEEANLEGCKIVDLEGQYIMPGLINLHVHLAGAGKPQKKKPFDPKKAIKLITSTALMRAVGKAIVADCAKTQLMSGTTTIRTVGGIRDFDTITRDKINAGKKIGPRIIAANMAISVPDGHMADSLAYVAHTPEEAANYVDVIAKDNPDLIKLMVTGGVMDAEVVGEPGVLKMQPELVRAACDRAHELGYIVAAHIESPAGVKVALENGVDSIEHGAAPTPEAIESYKKTGAFQVCTISPAYPYAIFDRSISNATYEQQENGKVVLNGIVDMAKECIKNDIPVGLGADTACPYVTQYNMWREVAYFIKYCEVSNQFALYTATLLNAQLGGVGDITGSIEVGKMADMIVVKDNPLENIRTLADVQKVIFEGTLYNNPKVKKFPEVEEMLDKYF